MSTWLKGLDLATTPERKAVAHHTVLPGIGYAMALEMRDSTGRLLGILAVLWVSARVYRVGILMYGQKPTFPELMKWVRYS